MSAAMFEPRWLPWELDFLRNHQDMTHPEIAIALKGKFTIEAIRMRRNKLGVPYTGGRSKACRYYLSTVEGVLFDPRGPDCQYDGRTAPCLKCWNRDGSRNRLGCSKCTERLKHDENTRAAIPVTGDQTAPRLLKA